VATSTIASANATGASWGRSCPTPPGPAPTSTRSSRRMHR